MRSTSPTSPAAPAEHAAPIAPGRRWAGRILSGVLALFLLFDAAMKIIGHPSTLEWAALFGLSPDAMAGIGLELLVCTALYVVPRTAVLGAVLLTGHLGGAICAHLTTWGGVFPLAFALTFGVLLWLGLGLRDRRVYALIAPPSVR